MLSDQIRRQADSRAVSIEEKRKQSAKLAADVEAFLSAGGRIQRLPGPGESSAQESAKIAYWADFETNRKRAAESGIKL